MDDRSDSGEMDNTQVFPVHPAARGRRNNDESESVEMDHTQDFFVHPYRRIDLRIGDQQADKPHKTDLPLSNHPKTLPGSFDQEVMAEKVAFAAKELAAQIKRSREFWCSFQRQYQDEVKSIKNYVDVDVLRQIWRKKVKLNGKGKDGEKQDGQQFGFHTRRIETYLSQIDAVAAALLAESDSSDQSDDHNSLQHHLEKVRSAGVRVVGLSKKTAANEAACEDLLEDLNGLRKLVDPDDHAAAILHPSHKPESTDAAKGGKKGKGSKGNKADSNNDGQARWEFEEN